ncbi:hypothetical protein BS78_05G217600 [Paspalum vaginatum]|nr:hypothetical protein BS78_05G217600 [Paspalum vaginatum]
MYSFQGWDSCQKISYILSTGMTLRNLSLMAVSLVDVEHLLNEWEIQCLVLLSFGLQVFLFLAADVRRRSLSRVVGVLIWLAYLSADSVAIFTLGHLAVHATGPNHQLVFLWAPFVLLHLGGQDTITAFSMQDNELWRRHLLTLAQQVALAVYDVSKSPWPDRRLLAIVMLMFLSGCIKYAERTVCLASARPDRLMADFLRGFEDRIKSIKEMQSIARVGLGSSRYLSSRAFSKFSLNPAMDVMSTDILPSYDWSVSRDIFADLYSKVSRLDHPSKEDYFRQMYRFAEERLFVCYQRLYTKAIFRLSPLGAFLHLVTFLSTSAAMVLFHFSVMGWGHARGTYSSVDVVVTYVLLAGAVALEVSSFVLSMFTRQDLWSHPVLCSCIQCRPVIGLVFCLTCGECAVRLRRWRPPQHWSQKLAQYNITERSAQQLAAGRSLLPRCIAEPIMVGTKPLLVTNDLKTFIIQKLLDADAMLTDSDFTGSRGEVALSKWTGGRLEDAAGAVLRESLKDVDFPTSVLLWHIATDVCFFRSATATAAADNPADDEEKKTISSKLSNYIMYLVFKCGVMRTSGSQFLLLKAQDEVIVHLTKAGKDEAQQEGKKNACHDEHVAMECLLRSGLLERSCQDLAAGNAAPPPPTPSAIEVLGDAVLPRAFRVAAALDSIRGRQRDQQAAAGGSCWDLIATVWLEMLYYVAPRCGASFHRQHLSTGGELVTHVLVLMYIVGPLGYHPDMLKRICDRGLYGYVL